MRARPVVLALWLLAGGAFLAAAPPGRAGDKEPAAKEEVKKAAGEVLKVEEELTKDDPKDKVRTTSHAKTHKVKLQAGTAYQIDMVSKEGNAEKFDPYLRLEDPQGRQVAEDDDSGGSNNARITYLADTAGTYTVVATTFGPGMTGKYVLTVKEAKLSKAALALSKLQQQFQKEVADLKQQQAKATTKDEKDNLEGRILEATAGHVERLLKFAMENRRDPAALRAQMEMRQNLDVLAGASSPAAAKARRGLLAKITQKDLKAQMGLLLANGLRSQSEQAYAKDKARSKQLVKDAEDLYEQVAKEAGVNPILTRMANDALYELKNLAIGMKAPDIEGEDLDGKKFKLSDYRGKVVVLDFWGNW
jgi:hypothetical protein